MILCYVIVIGSKVVQTLCLYIIYPNIFYMFNFFYITFLGIEFGPFYDMHSVEKWVLSSHL